MRLAKGKDMAPVLELRAVTKAFPGVVANDHIDFSLEKGEVHALLGENGAGKTTLMNVLYGLYTPDEGRILIRGQEAHINSPSDAIARGIGMVHQHFMLVPVMTVAENVMLGSEPVRYRFFLDRARTTHRIRQLSEQYGLGVDSDAYVEDLPVGVQQRVEIIKVLYREADILVLDEPTAVLTPREAEDLFGIMRSLVQQGKSIIFITHKLKEVFAIADRITVLRDGQVVGTTTPGETSERELAAMMVGREVALRLEKAAVRRGEPVLSVGGLRVMDDRGNMAVDGVSFEVHAGEILGVAGVQGNGQTELVEALTGLRPVAAGEVRIGNVSTANASPRRILELGVAHVPEDRQRDGLVLSYPLMDNLVLNTYYLPPFAHSSLIDEPAVMAAAADRIEQFDVMAASVFAPASTLSGGNQQKLIIAREFSRPIRLLIASQPTRGLDVGATEYTHQRILEKRDEGCAVFLVSPELDEVMALSDRIAVMYEGKIMAILPAEEASREDVGLLMTGARVESDHRVPSMGDQDSRPSGPVDR
jgi:ABC-type uncharacterized transport system ATPase subunit